MLYCEFVLPYIAMSESEKVEMGCDDPRLLYGHMSFDVQVHAICVLFFKVEPRLLTSNCVKWLLLVKEHLSIHAGLCNIWSNPKSYNGYYVHFCVLWILEVDSNDPHAGTTNDCLLLISTLHLCRYLLHMQVMILARSCGLLGSAITSVDGCCLYIIIHNSILYLVVKVRTLICQVGTKRNNSKISPILLV